MRSNPLDGKFVAIFKALRKEGGKAGAHFRELRSRVADSELGHVLDEVFSEVSARGPETRTRQPGEALQLLQTLRDRGCAEFNAFLFGHWKAELASVPFEEIIPVAASAAAVEAWRKAASISGGELESRLLSNMEQTYTTAGGDWLLLKSKPAKLAPLFDMLLSRRTRPKFLPGWAEALESALKKDKKGALLEALLRHSSPGSDGMVTLAEVVRLNPVLLRNILDALPQLLARKDAPLAAAELVEQVFRGVGETDGAEREFMTAALARLGTGIVLSERRNAARDAVLEVISKFARLLRNRREDDALAARTWVFENLLPQGERTGGRVQITLEGARDLGVAFENLAKGFDASEVLKVTAQNLGLRPIGAKGEAVSYNPLQHQDRDGGMLPGDAGVVESAGWAHGSDVVLRAKIRKGVTHV